MKTDTTSKGIGTGAVVAAVVAIILIVAAAYFIFVPSTSTTTTSSSTSTSTSSSSTSSTTTTSASTSTSTATGTTANVIIPSGIGSNMSLNFEPAALSVTAGTTVTWLDQDTSIHNIYFTSVPTGASIPENPSNNSNTWTNSQYSVTLDVAGTYTYVCQYHSWMKGTIVVTGTTVTSTSTTSTSTTSTSTTSTSTTSTSTTTTTSTTSTSTSNTTTTGPSQTIVIPVGIGTNTALNFEPDTLTVAPGTTIIFVNQDTTSIHNIYFTSFPTGATFATNPSANTNKWTDNEYSVTLTVAGTYDFVCQYHSWMTGTITVS